MNWFWVIIEISATIFEAMILFSFLNTFLKRSFDRRAMYVALPVIHAVFVTLLNQIALDQMATALLTLAFSCVIVFIFYQGSIFTRLVLTISFYTIWMASEFSILILLNTFIKDFIINLQQPSIERITAIAMSKLTIFIILKIVQQFAIKSSFKISFRRSLPLYILPIITVLIIISMQLFWTEQPTNTRFVLASISLVALLFANFIVFDQYRRLFQEAETLAQIKQLEQHQVSQKEMIKMMEDQNQEVRKIAHDIKNSLLPSILYLQQGKKEQSLDNLEQIVESLNNMQKSPMITGHPLIDLILSHKSAQAEMINTKIHVDSQLEEPIVISDTDICIILGNAMDNAIEANAKINDVELRRISIHFRCNRGILSIEISNPVEQDVLIDHGKIKTTKSEPKNHGLGLASIQEFVSKNEGVIKVQCEKRIFTLSIILANLNLKP